MGSMRASDKVRFRRITRSIRHDFDQRDRADLGDRLANCLNTTRLKGQEKSDFDAKIKADIVKIDGEAETLYRKVLSGYEMREIACEEKLDYESGTVTTTRLDTKAEIESRDMVEEEKQMGLKLDGKRAGKETPKNKK